jgi:hypothetical protein
MQFQTEINVLVTELCKIQSTKGYPNKEATLAKKRLQIEEVRNKARSLFKQDESLEIQTIQNICGKNEEDSRYILGVIFTEDYFKWKSDKIKALNKLGLTNNEILKLCNLKPELNINMSYIEQILKK